jgi:hypothetical protein
MSTNTKHHREVIMRWAPVFLLSCCIRLAISQTAQPPSSPPSQAAPMLSPQAAYDEARRPLDITRAPLENWSDVEQAALAVSIKKASESCKARTPYQFTGEDLIAYARLCFFGEEWQNVQLAASNYILAQQAAIPADKLTGFPNLPLAFDYSVQSILQLSYPYRAKSTAQTMLSTVPYDDMVSEATGLTARYFQFTGSDDDALALLAKRQPILLTQLQARSTPSSSASPNTPAPTSPPPVQSQRPTLSIHDLYADAIALPTMQQYDNQPEAATTSFAEVEAALPAKLSPDDAIPTADIRRQYLLLGSPLPHITAFAWLLDPSFTVPHDFGTNFGSATVLFLFPDWCGCVGMGSQFSSTAERLSKKGVRFYALLAQATSPPLPEKSGAKPPPPAASKSTAAKATDAVQPIRKPTAAEYLNGTPTIVVPNGILDTFVATDFPLIVVTDHRGIIRVIQTAPENALEPDHLLDQIVGHVLDHWPLPGPK